MSTPIRPTGGPLAPGIGGVEGAGETSGVGASEATQATTSVGAADSSSVHGTSVQGTTASLLARLEAGEVTREQAIEGLVRSALETHGGQRLPPNQRVELEAVLRAALLDDPTLARLLG